MTKGMKKISISLTALMLTLVCCATQGKNEDATADHQPAKSEKHSYPWTLSQCATTDSDISVKLSKDAEGQQKAVIYMNGKQTQVFGGEEPLFTDWYDQAAETFIHFVDANFDGHIDIFLGLGASRTYSTLLLWNPAKNKFERYGELGEPSLQNPVFSPHEKAIYESGSNSAWEYSFSKLEWKGSKLVETDNLYYYANPAEQAKMSGKKTSMFEKHDKNDNVVRAYKNRKQLPKNWQQIVDITLE